MFFRRVVVAIEDIVHTAAHKGDILFLAERGDRIVAGVGGRGDDDLVNHLRPARPDDHPGQYRLVAQFFEHLARQPAGGHAGLDDGNDLGGCHLLPPRRLNAISYACKSFWKFFDQSARSSARTRAS